jgi:putative endonuclease
MKQQNFEVGRYGEDIARKYLTQKGYKIITSNFKTKFGEIDLVAVKNKILVFVEVKLKIGDDFGTPEEMINQNKIMQVQNTATSFIIQNPEIEKSVEGQRIDAVCIVLDEEKQVKSLNHYENITF